MLALRAGSRSSSTRFAAKVASSPTGRSCPLCRGRASSRRPPRARRLPARRPPSPRRSPSAPSPGRKRAPGEVALHKAHALHFALRSHRRRRGARAAAAARPRRPACDGPHQRRHPFRRPGAPQRAGSDDEARAARAAAAVAQFARLRQAVRRDLQGRELRLLQIDPALFAPAEVWVSNLDSGKTLHAGALDMALLQPALAAAIRL